MGNPDQPHQLHHDAPDLPGPADEIAPSMPVIGAPQPYREDALLTRVDDSPGHEVVPASAYPRPELATQGAKTSLPGIFSDINRSGRWTVPPALTVTGAFSDAILDLREAIVTSPEVVITGNLMFGDLKVIVPPGVDADVDGLRVFGDSRTELHGDPAAGAYRVRVLHRGAFSDVRVVTLAPGEDPPKWWKSWW